MLFNVIMFYSIKENFFIYSWVLENSLIIYTDCNLVYDKFIYISSICFIAKDKIIFPILLEEFIGLF